MTEEKKIHQTHFTVPEIPYKKMEREAILFLQEIIRLYSEHKDCISDEYSFLYDIESTLYDIESALEANKDLVDWVMKYKGE